MSPETRKSAPTLESLHTSRRSWIYGCLVLLYEVVWFVLLLGCLLFDYALVVFIADIISVTFSDMASLSIEHILPLWNTIAWGGIGGALGPLYSLYWHAVVERDLNRQCWMWYIVQPITGIILGGIVYLTIAAGFIAVQVLVAQAPTVSEIIQAMANPVIKAFHSMVAILAGFRQRFVYEMLTRALRGGSLNRGDKRQQ